jgi:hypothetical protein
LATGAKNSDIPMPEAEADRLQDQAGHQEGPAADPVGQRAGDRGDHDRHGGPRQRAQPGLQRAVVLDDLQELGQQEDRAEHPEEHEQRGGVGHREPPAAEQSQRQHGLGSAHLPGGEGHHEQDADDHRRQHGEAGPAVVVAAHHAEDDAEQS